MHFSLIMCPNGMLAFFAFTITLCFSIALTWLVRGIARRFSFLAKPTALRWHCHETPILGGVAIFFSLVVGMVVFVPSEDETLVLILGASAMFLLGLIDDLIDLEAYLKLIIQVCICSLVASFGVMLQFSESDILNWLISLVWLVAVTNAVNLLDNMDGLCAGIAIIAGGYLVSLSWINGHDQSAMFALVFVASVSGFLVYNFNPASIFMGDSGSLCVGLLLAGMTISSNYSQARGVVSALLFPGFVLMLPVFDTALVSLTRRASGRPLAQGGRDHVSHRLVFLGFSEKNAVLILYGIAAVSGILAIRIYQYGFSYSLFVVGLFLGGLLLLGTFLSTVKLADTDLSTDSSASAASSIRLEHNKLLKRVLVVMFDSFLIIIAYYGAYWLRFDLSELTSSQLALSLNSLPILLILSLIVFAGFGLYRQDWQHFGIIDLLNLVKSNLVAVLITIAVLTYIFGFVGYSHSIFIIYWGTIVMLQATSRLSFSGISKSFFQ